MKFANVVVVGMVVIGTFVIVFAKAFTHAKFSSLGRYVVTVGECVSDVLPLFFCDSDRVFVCTHKC